MARAKIEMPSAFMFQMEMPVLISYINYGGHLGNDSVLSLAHEARLRILNSLGFNEMDIGGCSVIMSDAIILFRSEGFYGNLVRILINIQNFSTSSFEIYYRMYNETNSAVLADLKTGMVAFNYALKKVCPVPDQFRQKVESINPKITLQT